MSAANNIAQPFRISCHLTNLSLNLMCVLDCGNNLGIQPLIQVPIRHWVSEVLEMKIFQLVARLAADNLISEQIPVTSNRIILSMWISRRLGSRCMVYEIFCSWRTRIIWTCQRCTSIRCTKHY